MATPTITTNVLFISEGQTSPLSLNNLNATAEGVADAAILFTIVPTETGSLAGEFLLNGLPSLSFSLEDVDRGRVEFSHDSSNGTPSYSVVASNDGEESAADAADVTFNATNDSPDVEVNVLAIAEGGTVVLNSETVNLQSIDEAGESTAAELTYDIQDVTNGRLERLVDDVWVDLGEADDAFTQADVDNGLIRFVHDGSETAPTYRLRVVDSGLPGNGFNSTPQGQSSTAEITFNAVNDTPTLTKNELSLQEGDTVLITADILAAEDVEDNDGDLIFTITDITNGEFQLLDAPNGNFSQVLAAPGQDAVGFTQAQIAAGLIQFVNTPATNDQPSYTVTVSDSGKLTIEGEPDAASVKSSEPQAAIVNFTAVNDDPLQLQPVEPNPALIALAEGEQITLTAAILEVTDEETLPADLTYTVTGQGDAPNGQFLRLATDGGAPTPITEFTQADINAGNLIAFAYTGIIEPPTFTLTVTDSGGKTVVIDDSDLFNFIPENDLPAIVNQGFTVKEGESVELSSDNLLVTDEETAPADLEYQVTINNEDPTKPDSFLIGGVVESGPTVFFTQQQVNDGEVVFVHGGSQFAPDLSATVSDTEVAGVTNTLPLDLNIPFEGFNDPPELETFFLELTEGDRAPITAAVLSVKDEESAAADITYTLDVDDATGDLILTGGQFLRINPDDGSTTAITSFTQAEIDAGNAIAFQHDGLNEAPTFSLTVSDGENSITVTEQSGQGVDFTPTNDDPVVANNALAVPEGDPTMPTAITLTADNLLVTDEESAPADLTYTVEVTNNDLVNPDVFEIDGVIEDGAAGPVVFTQQQINDGLVKFIHGGSNTIATLTASVSDTFPTEFGAAITLEGVVLNFDLVAANDPPTITNNPLTIDEGETVLVTADILSTTDEETPAAEIIYTVTAATNGTFQRLDGLGAVTDIASDGTGTFTQAEIDGELIQFAHDGTETAPTYSLTVQDTPLEADGLVNTIPIVGATPIFTNVNDAPTFDVNSLTVLEGAEVIFSADNIAASDNDNPAAALRFKISEVEGGTFTFQGQPLSEDTSFSAFDLSLGDLVFVDDGDEVEAKYQVTVFDPLDGETSEFATVNLLADNDAPDVTVNTFTVAEGGRLTLNDPGTGVVNLAATDADNPDDELLISFANISGGQFVDFSAQAIAAGQTFTQAELNQGIVSFLQDGSSPTPTFEITVSDGTETGTVTVAADVTLEPINDSPTVEVSAFSVAEGGTVTLDETLLLTTDDEGESPPEDIEYKVVISDNDKPEVDQFQIGGVLEAGPEVFFTQADINAGEVKFIHGGSNTVATLTVTVSDSFPAEFGEPITLDVPLIVTLLTENDAPVVENKTLAINEGETKVLDQSILLTTDEESLPEDLTYTIQDVTNGTFQRLDTDLGTAADIAVGATFTQAEVNDGEIQFVQDGAEAAPTFSLEVADQPTNDGEEPNFIIFDGIIAGFENTNDDPSLVNNKLTVTEDDTVTLTAENLSAIDFDNLPSDLRFSIGNVNGGQFFLDGSPLADEQSFTAAAIAFGELTFKDDGDEETPSYEVTVQDGEGGNSTAAAEVTLVKVNDPPKVDVNTFTITEGKRLTLNNPDTDVINLAASDPETAADDLIFIVNTVEGGRFFDFDANEIAVGESFTQADLNQGEISFLHDGSETFPSFELTLSDGEGGEILFAGNVVEFIEVNDPPAIENAQLTVTEDASIIITLDDIAATDTDTPAEDLTFTITGAGGTFNLVDGETVVEADITNFTQAQIIAGQVQFVDDGDQTPPSLSIGVGDGEFDSAVVAVNILEFINVNDAPMGVDDSGVGFSTEEDTAFITASVLTNDTDVDPGDVENLVVTQIDGQDVAAGGITLASGAIASLAAADGTISYDPNGAFQLPAGATTEDSFTYTVSDGNGGTDTATVTVTIVGVNDDPIANDDPEPAAAEEEEAVILATLDNESVVLSTLLDNDSDPDGDSLRIFKINDATVNPGDTVAIDDVDTATVRLNEDGTLTYSPSDIFRILAVGQSAEDEFTYTITDDNGGEDTATVVITVNGANEAPVANDDLDPGFATTEGTPIALNVLANDTDFDFQDLETLTISSVDTTGLIGSITNNGSSLTYTPSQVLRGGETATETFTYTLADINGGSDTASVQVVVTGLNDAPIVANDSGAGFVTNEISSFTTANVLSNDIDPEGGVLSLTSVNTANTKGSVINNGNGTFTYNPNGAFAALAEGQVGTDSFSYTVQDDEGVPATATVTITVNGLLSSFFDFEQSLQRQAQSLAAPVPADTVGVFPLAQIYDEAFYLNQNPDVAALVGSIFSSGYQHFITFGLNEGRNPSALYNEAFYRARHPDIAAAIANGTLTSGLQHFLAIGHLEGRDPSVLFDQSDYLLNNPDVAAAVSNGSVGSAFQHYVLAGVDENRLPNLALFNEQFYLQTNPDVAAAGIDAYQHFIESGQFEGRRPSALYLESSYLGINGDVKAAVDSGLIPNGFQHYVQTGRFEGRQVFS
ncbi:MAG: cadherin-like domain-containing protein [Leptolyngbyaceae cyanobacterium]